MSGRIVAFLSLMGLFAYIGINAARANNERDVSVNIDGRTYSCSTDGNGGSICDRKALLFRQKLQACAQTYVPGDCAKRLWPDFKANNPRCVDEGSIVCIQFCSHNYAQSDCVMNVCR